MTVPNTDGDEASVNSRLRPGSDVHDRWRNWFILVGAFFGILVCVTSTISWSAGVFITVLEHELGWARRDISLAISIHTLAIFAGAPLAGALADRVDPGRLASVSMLAFGILLFLTPYLLFRIEGMWIAYLVLTVIGLGAGPTVLLRPVIVAFTRNRGLAIAVVLTGSGASAFLMPQLLTIAIAWGGWTWGYLVLGLLAVAVTPLLWFTLRDVSARGSSVPDNPTRTSHVGMHFSAAIRDRIFWIMSLVTLLGGFGMGGLAIHLLPFLRDSGLEPLAAAQVASIVGLASIAGRLGAGVALDRIESPIVATTVFLCGATGAVLLLLYASTVALPAVICIGLMIGAEVEVIAYSASRYFGTISHSTIFGWQYAMIALGSAAGGFLVGWSRDVSNSYGTGFAAIACLLTISALLCPFLGRYRYAVH